MGTKEITMAEALPIFRIRKLFFFIRNSTCQAPDITKLPSLIRRMAGKGDSSMMNWKGVDILRFGGAGTMFMTFYIYARIRQGHP
jgi:hypothetical protein